MKRCGLRGFAGFILFLTVIVSGFLYLQKHDETYPVLAGTGLENTVTVKKGKEDGASVYLIGGIHGDESAGILAAEQCRKLRLKAGTLYILSSANRYGAEHHQRLTQEQRDLNRNFPGDWNGCDAEQIAAAIYADIQAKKPDLVLDLHEAVPESGTRDALGNSVICQSIEEIGDLILDLLMESGQGSFGEKPLTLYGSPPVGSVNRIVTEELGIPVITLETDREETLEQRTEKQKAIIEFILAYLGML